LRKEEEQFLPFTKESAKLLVELTCPCTPRRLLKVCSLIFEQARKEKVTIIDTDFVYKTVTKYGEVSIKRPIKKTATISNHQNAF